jgi:2-phosphosulfolactate phosphatase
MHRATASTDSRDRGAGLRIDVAFTYPELGAFDLSGRAVVVIDVLRATTTMVAAFEHGCRPFIPTTTPEEARTELARHAPGTAILAGPVVVEP